MTRFSRAFRSGGRGLPSEAARTEPPSHSSVPDRALLKVTPHALLALNLSIDLLSGASELRLSDGCQKPFDPAHHACEQLPRQMTLRQEQPIITRDSAAASRCRLPSGPPAGSRVMRNGPAHRNAGEFEDLSGTERTVLCRLRSAKAYLMRCAAPSAELMETRGFSSLEQI